MAKSSKKKKSISVADDLIDSLMDELNSSNKASSKNNEDVVNILADTQVPEQSNEVEFPINNISEEYEVPHGMMESSEFVSQDTAAGPWKDLMGSGMAMEPNNKAMNPALNQNLEDNSIDLNLVPDTKEEVYLGPSAGDNGYESPDAVFQNSTADTKNAANQSIDATVPIQSTQNAYGLLNQFENELNNEPSGVISTNEKTIAINEYKNKKQENIFRPLESSKQISANVFTSGDASLIQAENLKLAQDRILSLEQEVDKLRLENEELASAAQIIHQRMEEMNAKVIQLEAEKKEIQESSHSEILILKGNLQFKESELSKSKMKVEELDLRLKSDFKKIRVRERELENRLELMRAEKTALVRAKDENILDLKKKLDQYNSELDNYRNKVHELNKTLDSYNDQFKRTVKALRVALSNLEVSAEDNITPFKKAE